MSHRQIKKADTYFDRLFLDCEVPTMPFIQRRFEEMVAPNWPAPYPSFKGRDVAGARFVYCRRVMRVTHDDGAVSEGVFPAIIFERRYSKVAGFVVAYPKLGLKEYIYQITENAEEFLPELTNAFVGASVEVRTSGATVLINPPADDVEVQNDAA